MTISIAKAINASTETLTQAGVVEPRMQARSLVAQVSDLSWSYMIAHPDHLLTSEQNERLQKLVARRADGEPLQYLTGHQEFFGLDFEVTREVLIPRPETELIVEAALELLKDRPQPLIADVGTGSGCIAISILNQLPTARVLAVDSSAPALKVAERNSRRHQVADRIELIHSDRLRALDPELKFDLIVSNPPYIAEDEENSLPREVRHEPRLALFAGDDGLEVIKSLLIETLPFLPSGGRFIFEIGFGQEESVKTLIDRRQWELVEIRHDLQNIPRAVVLGKK